MLNYDEKQREGGLSFGAREPARRLLLSKTGVPPWGPPGWHPDPLPTPSAWGAGPSLNMSTEPIWIYGRLPEQIGEANGHDREGDCFRRLHIWRGPSRSGPKRASRTSVRPSSRMINETRSGTPDPHVSNSANAPKRAPRRRMFHRPGGNETKLRPHETISRPSERVPKPGMDTKVPTKQRAETAQWGPS
jgi:hypothetical protein